MLDEDLEAFRMMPERLLEVLTDAIFLPGSQGRPTCRCLASVRFPLTTWRLSLIKRISSMKSVVHSADCATSRTRSDAPFLLTYALSQL